MPATIFYCFLRKPGYFSLHLHVDYAPDKLRVVVFYKNLKDEIYHYVIELTALEGYSFQFYYITIYHSFNLDKALMDLSNVKQYASIDEMLIYVGEFGPYQWSLIAIFFFMYAVGIIQQLVMPFAAIKPPWRCILNSSVCLLNGTLPIEDNRRCHMSRSEWTYVEPTTFSIVTQFDLHCDREWLLEIATTAYFIGYAFGAVVLGWVADNYGRRTVIIPSHFLTLLVGFVTSFSTDIAEVIVSRLVLGFLFPGIYVQTMILLSELVGIRYRVLACTLMSLAAPLFCFIMFLQPYYIREWKILFVLCSAPYAILVLLYKHIPESIRWLRLKGQSEKVATTLYEIARRNKKAIPENIDISPVCSDILESKTSPIDIFRSKRLAIQSVVQGYCWFAVQFVYFGIYYSASNLGGSIYRDGSILMAADIPAYFLAMYFCEYSGRKKSFIFSTLTAGVAYMSIAFVPSKDNLKYIIIILGSTAKLLILFSSACSYQWTIEIYPTKVRAVGLGFVEVCGRIGSGVAPWIANGLPSVSKNVPVMVMGIVALAAGFVALLLPETKGKAIAECIEASSDVQDGRPTENDFGASSNSC